MLESSTIEEAFTAFYTCSDLSDNVWMTLSEGIDHLDLSDIVKAKEIESTALLGIEHCDETQKMMNRLEKGFEYIRPKFVYLMDKITEAKRQTEDLTMKKNQLSRYCTEQAEKLEMLRMKQQERREYPRKSDTYTVVFPETKKPVIRQSRAMTRQNKVKNAIKTPITYKTPISDETMYFSISSNRKDVVRFNRDSMDDADIDSLKNQNNYDSEHAHDQRRYDDIPRLIDDPEIDSALVRSKRNRSRGLSGARKVAKKLLRRSRSLSHALRGKRALPTNNQVVDV